MSGKEDQGSLYAGVHLAGLLIDQDWADSADSRRFFMCWQLTTVLAPSLAEIVPPAVTRAVVAETQAEQAPYAPLGPESQSAGSFPAAKRDTEPPPGPQSDQVQPVGQEMHSAILKWIAALAPTLDNWSSKEIRHLLRDKNLLNTNWWMNFRSDTQRNLTDGAGYSWMNGDSSAAAITDDMILYWWPAPTSFGPPVTSNSFQYRNTPLAGSAPCRQRYLVLEGVHLVSDVLVGAVAGQVVEGSVEVCGERNDHVGGGFDTRLRHPAQPLDLA